MNKKKTFTIVNINKWTVNDTIDINLDETVEIITTEQLKYRGKIKDISYNRITIQTNYGDMYFSTNQIDTLTNLSSNRVDVTDFGAIGNANYLNNEDGSYYADDEFLTKSTDDTKAINEAIQYAKNNGIKEVYIPEGSYLIDGYASPQNFTMIHSAQQSYLNGIQLESNIKLQLHDNAIITTNKVDSGYSSLLVINNKSDVEICGGKLIGDIDIHTSTHNCLYGINICNACNNIIIHDMEITKFTDDGIMIVDYTKNESKGASTNNVEIYNLNSHHNGRQGITIASGSNIKIHHCKLSHQTMYAPRSGIDIELEGYEHIGVKNLEISNCEFIGNGTDGIIFSNLFNDAPKSMSRNVLITNNIVKDSENGVRIAGQVIGVEILNNYIEINSDKPSSNGMWFSSSNTKSAIARNNKIYSPLKTNNVNGVLDLSKGAIITDNVFVGQNTVKYLETDITRVYERNIEVAKSDLK